MKNFIRQFRTVSVAGVSAALLALGLGLGLPSAAQADEDDAKALLLAMSDYMSALKSFTFSFDAIPEVVTEDNQKLGIASSGTVALTRPDKFHVTRKGGFADAVMNFDGKTFTLFGKNMNSYAQVEIPGTVDHLIDELQHTHGRALPAADLLVNNPYELLMADVTDIKDLGSGVIGGIECNYFAFRTEEVDWEIWIAMGDRPYPCRFAITSRLIEGEPSYSIQMSNWKMDKEVAATDFTFKNTTDAQKIDPEEISEIQGMPHNFNMEGSQ